MKKKFLALITSALILCTMTACTAPQPQTETETQPTYEDPSLGYYSSIEQYDIFEVINTPDLTFEDLESRNGKLIIERIIGICYNAETGEGKTFGTIEDASDYISYASVKGIQNGDIVCTFIIYNPSTNDADDVLDRHDYIIARGTDL